MLLAQQIQAILYHVMMGWVYGCTFSFLCSLTAYLRFSFMKGLLEVIYHIGFTILMFYGLYKINGGVTNLYLIILFILGVFVYYRFYLPVFNEFFIWFRHLFRPFQRFRALVKSKILVIIKKKKAAIRKRRKAREQRRKEKDENTASSMEDHR